MTTTPQEAAARWQARISGHRPPMGEDQLERSLAFYSDGYVDGTFSLAELEAGVERTLRAYLESRA